LAIVLGLWAVLIAVSFTFSAVAPAMPELHAHKLPATAPAAEAVDHSRAGVFSTNCHRRPPATG